MRKNTPHFVIIYLSYKHLGFLKVQRLLVQMLVNPLPHLNTSRYSVTVNIYLLFIYIYVASFSQ